jgi:hypothetical protein
MPAGEPGSAVPGGPRESAQAAALHYSRAAADAVRDAGAADSRLGAEVIGASVRRAIAAWVKGAEGDEAALAAVTRSEAVPALLHPPRAGERTRLVARNLLVTDILVDHLRADAEPPVLGVYADCRGLRYVESLATGSLLSGDRDADAPFVQFLRLTLDAPGPWPWRVSGGDTRLLTPPLDYMYSCRRETPAEYHARRGARTTPPPGARPRPRFQIRADFVEHDERRTGSAVLVVEQDTTPTRVEAAQLAYPAIAQETARLLGEGDWRPSLASPAGDP